MDGQSVGPKTLYDAMREKAEQVKQRMKSASPAVAGDGNKPSVGQEGLKPGESVYDKYGIAKDIKGIYVSLNPPVPEVNPENAGDREKIELAEILPPRPVVLTVGRAYARLPEPERLNLAAANPSTTPILLPSADYHWVTLFGSLRFKEQRALFANARYESTRQEMLVASVEAERQERLATGEWSEPVAVNGYAPMVFELLETVELDAGGNVTGRSGEDIRAYRAMLESQQAQQQILRPPFRQYLDHPEEWRLPSTASMLGEIRFSDYLSETPGSSQPPPELRPGITPGPEYAPAISVTPSISAGVENVTTPWDGKVLAASDINKVLRDIKMAIDDKKWREAQKMIGYLQIVERITKTQKSQLDTYVEQITPELEKLEADEARKRRLTSGSTSGQPLAKDIDLFWLTDTSVQPGRTCRYRVRLVVFNQYVGFASVLTNPQDAGKVVIRGSWTDWTSPIQVEPSVYLFHTAVKGEAATFVIHEWAKGKWSRAGREKPLGAAMIFPAAGRDLVYDGILVTADSKVPFLDRSMAKDGRVSYKEVVTTSAILVTSNGDVEEHIAAMDSKKQRSLTEKLKAEAEPRSEVDKPVGRGRGSRGTAGPEAAVKDNIPGGVGHGGRGADK